MNFYSKVKKALGRSPAKIGARKVADYLSPEQRGVSLELNSLERKHLDSGFRPPDETEVAGEKWTASIKEGTRNALLSS